MIPAFLFCKLNKGFPEINERNLMFGAIRNLGVLIEGTDSAEIHEAVRPGGAEPLVVKRRVLLDFFHFFCIFSFPLLKGIAVPFQVNSYPLICAFRLVHFRQLNCKQFYRVEELRIWF